MRELVSIIIAVILTLALGLPAAKEYGAKMCQVKQNQIVMGENDGG